MTLSEVRNAGLDRPEQIADPVNGTSLYFDCEELLQRDADDFGTLALHTLGGAI
jgi:hypothetical protein